MVGKEILRRKITNKILKQTLAFSLYCVKIIACQVSTKKKRTCYFVKKIWGSKGEEYE